MIIAFTGLAGSGKTTASDYLVQKYGFKKINFKDALVAEMKDRLGDTLEQLVQMYYTAHGIKSVDELFQKKPPVMRALLQNYGTEVRRRDDDNYWVNRWSATIDNCNSENVVVDDCRFLNEAKVVKDYSGTIIRIVRTDITNTGNHQSEVEQMNINHDYEFVANNGEQEKLYKYLDDLIEKHGD